MSVEILQSKGGQYSDHGNPLEGQKFENLLNQKRSIVVGVYTAPDTPRPSNGFPDTAYDNSRDPKPSPVLKGLQEMERFVQRRPRTSVQLYQYISNGRIMYLLTIQTE